MFSVTAAGSAPLAYVWRQNGNPIYGATDSKFIAYGLVPSDDQFDVVVANSFGAVTSQVARVIIDLPPSLATQPLSLTVAPGQTAGFFVEALGSPLLHHQWRHDGLPLSTNGTGSNYVLTTAQFADAGAYDVVVTNAFGAITSRVATLKVRDTNFPAITAPSNVVVQCNGPDGAVVGFTVSVADPYDPRAAVTSVPPSGSLFPIGFTTVTSFALDRFGNTATNHFTIQVTGDCDAGYVTVNCPSNIVVGLAGQPTVQVDYAVRGLNTHSKQPVPVYCTPPPGSSFPFGTNVVNCVASAGGSTSTCSFLVIVTNGIKPTLQFPPMVMVSVPDASDSGEVGAFVSYKVNLLFDPSGHTVITVNPPSGSFFPPGTNLVAVTALGPDGGRATGQFPVIVIPGSTNSSTDNWGFENPSGFVGWYPSGSAFAYGPVVGDLFTVKRIPNLKSQMESNIGGDYWEDVYYSVGHKGQRWVCTANIPDAGPNGNLDDLMNDSLVGTLVSKAFDLPGKYVSFLIGGGVDNDNLRVELLIESPYGDVIFKGSKYQIVQFATGHGNELMRRQWWSVGQFKGKSARIRIIDNSAKGHLNVDDFQFPDLSPGLQTVTLGLTNIPAIVTFEGNYYDWDSPVWGFADMHSHPMSYLGFGQKLFHGQPDGGANDPENPSLALGDCNPDHGGFGVDNLKGDYFRELLISVTDGGGLDPHRQGWDPTPMKQFSKWPVFSTLSHQQMWYEWIRRSYDGGQRIMVALCVNSKLLATASKGTPGAPRTDREVADLQIEQLTNFVARHSDFMEIAYSPFDLRDIVRRDKLAIIIGVELDDIGNLVEDGNVKETGPYDFPDDYSAGQVTKEITRLYNHGVRYMFTVHLADNKFGGTPIANDLLNIGSKFLNGYAETTTNADQGDNINFHLSDLSATFSNAQSQIDFFVKATIYSGGADIALAAALLPAIDTFLPAIAPVPPGAGALAGGLLPLVAVPLIIAEGDPNGALGFLLKNVVGLDNNATLQLQNANLLPLPGNYPAYPDNKAAPFGVRNARGLTRLGRYAVEVAMGLGMMLDVDHMSQDTLNSVIDIAKFAPGGYPLNSGHNSFRELGYETTENHRSPAQLEAIRQLGGLMGVGWENSAEGSHVVPVDDAIPNRQYTVSEVANNCAGTTKTWAQLYLYALEKLHGKGVAFGTDADGLIQFPGPRFGPQSAYGLQSAFSPLRNAQVEKQFNGVLYTPKHGNALMTAFNGRSVDPGDDHVVRHYLGYEYSKDMARFFAALQIYYYEVANMTPGETQDEVGQDLQHIQDNLSPDNFQDGLLGIYGARHIKELAFGMIDGLKGWDTGMDIIDTDVGTLQQLGKSIYREKIAGLNPVSDVQNDSDKLARFFDLEVVWDHYQRIFGNNKPMTRCQTGTYKQWDVNFEGVAHYGLIPDFLQDLSNVGMQSSDMSVLFHSAEDFAQMWTKCLQGSAAFQPHFYDPGHLLPDGTLVMSYATGADNYVLEESPDLTNWNTADVSARNSDGAILTVRVPAHGRARFYRLHRQPNSLGTGGIGIRR